MSLKKKLNSGVRIYGTAIVSTSPLWTAAVRQADLDFIFIDTEHIPLGRETVAKMCALYSAVGIPPMVRIPSPDPYTACTALDGGASAILAPYVESLPAIDNLKELLSVPGLDGVIIGPHDLSCSMGVPEEYTNPVFKDTVTGIINECRQRNLGIGIHLSEAPGHQVRWAKAGVNIILHSSDVTLFGKMLDSEIKVIKIELGENDRERGNQSNTI